jgi:glycosyltransferase involved in cell wall biosynthesis
MKSESLIRTIDVVRDLGRQLPLRLIIVGDGAARSRLEGMAGETNAKLGRTAVTLTGMLMDPRPAYAAADIVVGMGGSALRGMAFGKAVVIVGERGFSAPFTPDTAESFYYKGIYGRGVGEADYERLAADIRGLAELPGRLAALGEFSRQFVGRRYSLETVCGCLADFLEGAVREVPRFHVAATDGLRTAAVYLRERGFLIPSRDPTPKQ